MMSASLEQLVARFVAVPIVPRAILAFSSRARASAGTVLRLYTR